MPNPSRRALMLGGAALALSGCETIDSIFGDSKTPLPGERLPVIQADRSISISARSRRTSSATSARAMLSLRRSSDVSTPIR